jgi:hypothetical protein
MSVTNKTVPIRAITAIEQKAKNLFDHIKRHVVNLEQRFFFSQSISCRSNEGGLNVIRESLVTRCLPFGLWYNQFTNIFTKIPIHMAHFPVGLGFVERNDPGSDLNLSETINGIILSFWIPRDWSFQIWMRYLECRRNVRTFRINCALAAINDDQGPLNGTFPGGLGN